nr:MAG TPA: hypothetical protein [Inoviridae sp.]
MQLIIYFQSFFILSLFLIFVNPICLKHNFRIRINIRFFTKQIHIAQNRIRIISI